MENDGKGRPRLAICQRFGVLALAVVASDQLLEVRRTFKGNNDATGQEMMSLQDLAHDYGLTDVVVEPGCTLCSNLAHTGLNQQILTLEEAKLRLLGKLGATHAELCQRLIQDHQKLARFVTILPLTGRVAMSQRRRIVSLLAVAMGLAACQAT